MYYVTAVLILLLMWAEGVPEIQPNAIAQQKITMQFEFELLVLSELNFLLLMFQFRSLILQEFEFLSVVTI